MKNIMKFFKLPNLKKEELYQLGIFIFIILLAIMIRIWMIPFESGDYKTALSNWYDYIKNNGGMAALKNREFTDYLPFYLYILVFATLLPIHKLIVIKTITIIFDFICVYGVYQLIKDKAKNAILPFIAAFIIMFEPTLLMNGALWGQCDVIFTTFLVLSLYSFIKDKEISGLIFYAIAFSFKLQAIFFAPVLVILFLKDKIKFRNIVFVSVSTFVVNTLPIVFVGGDWLFLIKQYGKQVRSYPGSLSNNAPSLYNWIPDSASGIFSGAGIYFAVAVVLIVCFMVYKSRKKISPEILIKLSLLFTLVVPYLLPKMHERYFFAADIFSIIYAFYFPKYYFIPIVVILCSYFSYTPFLLGANYFSGSYLTLALLVVISIVARDLYYTISDSDSTARE